MQDKTELKLELCTDEFTHIASFLECNSKALSGLLSVDRELYNAIQPKRLALSLIKSLFSGNTIESDRILKTHPEFKINQLLWYLVSGNQVKAEEMLIKDPGLLLASGSIIDISGRYFNNIRPFELVLWNMDVRYMGRMIVNCIPENEYGTVIWGELLNQYNQVEEQGVTFTLNGKEHTESHFSYQPLIKVLHTYVTCRNNWDDTTSLNFWIKEVGKEQFLLTIEGRNQYCHPTRALSPKPDFEEEFLERGLSLLQRFRVDGEVEFKEQIWNTNLTGLGEDFAICRFFHETALTVDYHPLAAEAAKLDLDAIALLADVRTRDLLALKALLEKGVQKTQEDHEVAQFKM